MQYYIIGYDKVPLDSIIMQRFVGDISLNLFETNRSFKKEIQLEIKLMLKN